MDVTHLVHADQQILDQRFEDRQRHFARPLLERCGRVVANDILGGFTLVMAAYSLRNGQ
jgi:hypothetical protein